MNILMGRTLCVIVTENMNKDIVIKFEQYK